jgi:hypothetical protein
MRLMQKLVMGAAAALLLLAGPGTAEAASSVQTLKFENEYNALASANFTEFCGFPIEVYDTGAVILKTVDTKSGPVRYLTLQSLVVSYVNAETRQTVTLRSAIQVTEKLTLVEQTSGQYVYEGKFVGLNFLDTQHGPAVVSAGKGDVTLLAYLNSDGTLYDVQVIQETSTINLKHTSSYVCTYTNWPY